jgi:hypothetical protein|tara:strand:+ start:1729 stop:1911 length:183 start_codon:yes stop_codon:yes gene_type:complete
MHSANSALKDKDIQGVVLFGASLSVLISGANEKSVRMPHGMTREERRQWVAKSVRVAVEA